MIGRNRYGSAAVLFFAAGMLVFASPGTVSGQTRPDRYIDEPLPGELPDFLRNWIGPAFVPPGARATDEDLREAIESRLARDIIIPFDWVNVTVNRGVVSLTGEVGSLLARDRAEAIAAGTRNVRSVVNRLVVKRYALKDEVVAENVQRALAADPATDESDVDVSAVAGVVGLSGRVPSRQAAELIVQVARGVRGVVGVENRMNVSPAAERADDAIATDIRRRLDWDRRVDAGRIDVRVRDGRVTLSGMVGSAAEASVAAADAWVDGVKDVNTNLLAVGGWWDRTALAGPEESITDGAVAQAVRDTFLYDPRVASFKVGVAVRGGLATLTGVVDNFEAKRAAERDALNTVGVDRVRNLIKVRGSRLVPDDALETAVRDALARDPLLEPYPIRPSVTGGVVYLRGKVSSDALRDHAEAVAGRVAGVVGVRNLVVPDFRKREQSSDAELRDEVRDLLRWSPYVDAGRINVSVRDGIVTLAGAVDTGRGRAVAEQLAWDAGADRVVLDLKVRPESEARK